ncbi:hypothetical protein LV476_04695 [Guyparkeria hydrothermalis]|uniref:hypothetical protein n=1 Tax=Guyparkeria hydrothermalis TaxID=923 RepID=UPI00202239D4|nr:hypothetical protein [Guyparkeria hydrothermalis]MCL7744249.1 hypothetical protein [Guyparkeria hydrothermalis]
MRTIVAATALTLASTALAPPVLAAEDEPWKKPGWEPISEEERQPATPDQIDSSAVDVQENRGVSYMTGGLGSGERAWLEQHGTSFPVTLQFSKGQRGAFVSSVNVTIHDQSGQTLFEATTDGPLIYIDLPAGNYQTTVNYRDHVRDFDLRVPSSGRTSKSINFP